MISVRFSDQNEVWHDMRLLHLDAMQLDGDVGPYNG